MTSKIKALAMMATCLSGFSAVQAAESDNIWAALKDGKADLSLRYRLELVDQDNLNNNATASTLQTLLGYKTGTVNGFSGYVQFRNVTNIGGTKFNSTINGKTQYPVVADAPSTEVDQAYLNYSGFKNINIAVGRKRVNWDNKRFISSLGWRQNMMSLDGAFFNAKPMKGVDLNYAYASNINRTFTDKSTVGNMHGSYHLLNGSYKIPNVGKITGYGYLLDVDETFGIPLSTQTWGASLKGGMKVSDSAKFGYYLELANQKDYATTFSDYSVNYYHIMPSVSFGKASVKVGYEVLEGDGFNSFKTPIGLLHAFNGWADKFLGTPPNGLEDAYAAFTYTFKKGVKMHVAYHDFRAENISSKYGSEVDANITFPLMGPFKGLLKVAHYNATNFSVDTTKIWFMMSAKF